jgi:hypothetical protein
MHNVVIDKKIFAVLLREKVRKTYFINAPKMACLFPHSGIFDIV